MDDLEKKLEGVKAIVQAYADRQGHERCWYLPELFDELTTVLEITPTKPPLLPPRCEFEAGCKKYQDEQYGKGNV